MLLHAVLCARIKPTFHKINVHAAMTPSDIQEHFKPVFDQARELSDAYNKSKERAYKKDSVDETDFIDISSPLASRRRSSTGKRALISVMTTLVPGMGHSVEEEETSSKKFTHRMPSVTVSHQRVSGACLWSHLNLNQSIHNTIKPTKRL